MERIDDPVLIADECYAGRDRRWSPEPRAGAGVVIREKRPACAGADSHDLRALADDGHPWHCGDGAEHRPVGHAPLPDQQAAPRVDGL